MLQRGASDAKGYRVKRTSLDTTLESLVRNFSQAVMNALRDQAKAAPGAASRRGAGGGSGKGVTLPARLDELEEQAIDAALEAADGNRTRAAEILGINRVTLYKKLLSREAAAKRAAKSGRGKPAAKSAGRAAKSARGGKGRGR